LAELAEVAEVAEVQDEDIVDFAGVSVKGTAARWLKEQQQATGGMFKPTPIQELAVPLLFEGRAVALGAPTGTGKTLAYLLPLLQRLQLSAKTAGPRILVLTPIQDLQRQVGRVAKALLGDEASVFLLENGLGAEERLAAAGVVIATPKSLQELAAAPLQGGWQLLVGSLDAMVIDEVDSLMPLGHKKWPMGELLDRIASTRTELGTTADIQLVVASASMDARMVDTLSGLTECDFILARARATPEPMLEETALWDDGLTPVWPPGLEHYTLAWPGQRFGKGLITSDGAVSPEAMELVAQAIASTSPARCLVVLAERRRVQERAGTSKKYLHRLRPLLGPFGYQVMTASAAVEFADKLAEVDADSGEAPKRLIIGRAETIRGIDLEGMDAVFIVGTLGNKSEYLHLAGRTSRYSPGLDSPPGGQVVSILEVDMTRTLRRWSREMGIRLETFQLKPWPKPKL